MTSNSALSALSALPTVSIDPEGTFKYVLIEATAEDDQDQEHARLLVRGNRAAEYHADVYDDLEESARAKGVDCQCLGGGRIKVDKAAKEITIYGYSMGFGRADHSKTAELVKEAYPGYKVEWNNEGY